MSNFTGRLGASNTELGNIELGSDASDPAFQSNAFQEDAFQEAPVGGPGDISDSVASLTETVIRQAALSRSASDTVATLSDAVTRTGTFSRALSDTLSTLSEAVTRVLIRVRSVADSISSISDSITRISAKSRTASATIASISETVTRSGATKSRSAADSLGSMSEAVTQIGSLRRGLFYVDGFNTYTDPVQRYWDSSHAQIVGSAGRDTTQACLRINRTNTIGYVRRQLDWTTSGFIVGLAFKMNNAINTWPFYACENGGSILHVGIEIDGSNHLLVRRGNSTTLGTGTTVLSTGTWYWLEFKATIDSSGGTYELRLNGTTELSATGVNTRNGGNGQMDTFQIGNSAATANGTWDFVDLYIADTVAAGTLNRDFRGDSKIITLLPDADGHYTEWYGVGAAGTNGNNLSRSPSGGSANYSGTGTPANAADGNIATGPGWTGSSGSFWQVDFTVAQLVDRVRAIYANNGSSANLGVITLTTDTGLSMASNTITVGQTYEWNFDPVNVRWVRLTSTSGRSGTADLGEAEIYLRSNTPAWSLLNEVPPDDNTSYIYASAIGQRDSLSVANLNFARNIGGIQHALRSARAQGGLHYLMPLHRDVPTGTDSTGTTGVATPTKLLPTIWYSDLLPIWEVSPDTGQRWTQEDVNNSEFGVEVDS